MVYNKKTNFSFYSNLHFQRGTVEPSKTKKFYPGSCFGLTADFISNFLHHGANDYWPSRLRAPITQSSLCPGLADPHSQMKFNSEYDTIKNEDIPGLIIGWSQKRQIKLQKLFGIYIAGTTASTIKANEIIDIIRWPYINIDNYKTLHDNKGAAYFLSSKLHIAAVVTDGKVLQYYNSSKCKAVYEDIASVDSDEFARLVREDWNSLGDMDTFLLIQAYLQ